MRHGIKIISHTSSLGPGTAGAEPPVRAPRAGHGSPAREGEHDTVLIAAAFCMLNRYVNGLATIAPQDPALYAAGAQHLIKEGCLPPPAT